MVTMMMRMMMISLSISSPLSFLSCKATLGYFAMLVAMTYQVELFVSIIAGRKL
jgi:hypothetical protein